MTAYNRCVCSHYMCTISMQISKGYLVYGDTMQTSLTLFAGLMAG